MSVSIVLKLGTKCNLGCPHCHQNQKNFVEHPGLLSWLKNQNISRLTFSGGEPLLYWDIIKRYMENLGHDITYRIMDNGTLLNDDVVNFLNSYNVQFAISYDGETGGRDMAIPIKWDYVSKIKSCGISSVASSPNFSFRQHAKDVSRIKKLNPGVWKNIDEDFCRIEWVHQIQGAPNPEFTIDVAEQYVKQYILQLRQAFYCFSNGLLDVCSFNNLVRPWVTKHRSVHGVKCCNENLISVNLDGTVMVCPYGTTQIGTIDSMPTIDTIDSLVPKKCKVCEFWDYCHCSCVASITDLDCYVHKCIFKEAHKLLKDYHLENHDFGRVKNHKHQQMPIIVNESLGCFSSE